jgi:hypothetical protein
VATITIGRRLTAAVDSVTATQGPAGASPWPVKDVTQLVPENYDYIGLTYSGSKITQAVYRLGGSAGTVVATVNLAYSGSKLTSVART